MVTLAAIIAGSTTLPPTVRDSDLPIAVQTYTMRDHGTLEEQLQTVEDAGVSNVDFFVMEDADADEAYAMREAHGIDVISTQVALDRLRNDLDAVVQFNSAIGNDTIVVPYLPEDMRHEDAAGWQELGGELAGLPDDLATEGMRPSYHNHDFEMVEYDSRAALEIMFEAAGPNVMVEIDLAWVVRGGQDLAEYLRTIGDSVFAVHAKDNAPEGENEDQRGFATVGEGTLDWPSILTAAEEVGNDWFIIEHDQPLDPAQAISTSADFLREALPEW